MAYSINISSQQKKGAVQAIVSLDWLKQQAVDNILLIVERLDKDKNFENN